METNYLASVPVEIIEIILMKEGLSFVDILNFGCTCTEYWQLIHKSNQLWKEKFKQMWPRLSNHEAYKYYVVSTWFDEFRHRWTIGQQAKQLLFLITDCHIKYEELTVNDFKEIDKATHSIDHKLRLQYLIDEYMICVHNTDRNTDLTNKYYSEKILRYLKQFELAPIWENYKTTDPDLQVLEKGAAIVAQWAQPLEEITYKSIASQLNTIAARVYKRIRMEHGDKHAALKVPRQVRSNWKTHNLVDNYYSPYVSRQIINAVSTVLFQEIGFTGNNDLYYSYEHSCINKVLEDYQGNPITLAILYESVARRLGVKCEPVVFTGHFLLRWRDTYLQDVPSQYFYIDVLNGGKFLGKDSCPQFSNAEQKCPFTNAYRVSPASVVKVVEKLANSLELAGRQCSTIHGRAARIRNALELVHLISPYNISCLLQLARCYIQNNLDVSGLQQTLEYERHFALRDMGQVTFILATLRDYQVNVFSRHQDTRKPLDVKRRVGDNQAVQFAVGMIMRHRQYNYTCVVVGWDPRCVATEKWVVQMNVRNLTRQDKQPFYQVLVNDGTSRYAAEENLEVESNEDRWVTHSDIGRYFDTFCVTHYMPNPELLQAYPDDLPLLQQQQ